MVFKTTYMLPNAADGIKTFEFSSLVSSKIAILCNFVPWSFYLVTFPVCTGHWGGGGGKCSCEWWNLSGTFVFKLMGKYIKKTHWQTISRRRMSSKNDQFTGILVCLQSKKQHYLTLITWPIKKLQSFKREHIWSLPSFKFGGKKIHFSQGKSRHVGT